MENYIKSIMTVKKSDSQNENRIFLLTIDKPTLRK